MFSGIKDKLLNVKKNVGLFATEENANLAKNKSRLNSNAGAPILQHFQDHWEDIHNLNEENAKHAENVANEIENIKKKVTQDKTNIDLITHILTNSNLMTNITQCLSQVKELYNICENVEQKLVDLECYIEDDEFNELLQQHRMHLENYRTRKQENLHNVKLSLEEQYQKKVNEHETSKKTILEERQKVFQEAFKNDLEVYKSLGTLPKLELPKAQNCAILEEIQLDFDQNELEQFFNNEEEELQK